MEIRSQRDLGQLIKSRREELRMTQAALAVAVGASRKWVSEMEAGKSTTEIGRVFAVLAVLDIRISNEQKNEVKTNISDSYIPDVSAVLSAYGERT